MSHQMEIFWFSIEAWILDNWINKEIKRRNWDAKRLLRFPVWENSTSRSSLPNKDRREYKSNVLASLFPARRLIFSKGVWRYTDAGWQDSAGSAEPEPTESEAFPQSYIVFSSA